MKRGSALDSLPHVARRVDLTSQLARQVLKEQSSVLKVEATSWHPSPVRISAPARSQLLPPRISATARAAWPQRLTSGQQGPSLCALPSQTPHLLAQSRANGGTRYPRLLFCAPSTPGSLSGENPPPSGTHRSRVSPLTSHASRFFLLFMILPYLCSMHDFSLFPS